MALSKKQRLSILREAGSRTNSRSSQHKPVKCAAKTSVRTNSTVSAPDVFRLSAAEVYAFMAILDKEWIPNDDYGTIVKIVLREMRSWTESHDGDGFPLTRA